MEYNQFVINPFELRRGKWRARISRRGGAALVIKGQILAREIITNSDEKTAADALLLAMDMIDWGTISTAAGKAPVDGIWRRAGTLELG